MSPHGLYWDARAHLKKSNAVARDLFIFVAFIYDHPVFVIYLMYCYIFVRIFHHQQVKTGKTM